MSLINPGAGKTSSNSYSASSPSNGFTKKSGLPVKKNDFRHSLTNVRIYFIFCYVYITERSDNRFVNDCLTI